MIWSFLKKNRLISGGLLAICCLFSVFFLSSKTFAVSDTYTWEPQTFNLYNYIRLNSRGQLEQTYNFSVNQTMPYTFMTPNGSPPARKVFGMHLTNFSIPNQNYHFYNKFSGHLIFSATDFVQISEYNNNDLQNMVFVNAVHSDGTFKQKKCMYNYNVAENSSYASFQFDCEVDWEDGKAPAYIDFQVGELNLQTVRDSWVNNGRYIFVNYGLNNAGAPLFATTNLTFSAYGFKITSTSSVEEDYYSGVNNSLDEINNSINNLNINNNYQQIQDQQDRNSVQNTSDNATQAGNNATTNANNATSSILGAITGIYGQLLHPSTSDCVISGVQVYQLNLGNLDFCTGFDIPQPIFAVGGLIMIGLIILLSWSILKAGMGLYNDLLGGK